MGNNAIAAPQQAAVLDFHISPVARAKARNPAGDVDQAEAAEQVGEFPLVSDYFCHVRQLGNFFRGTCRITPHHHDPAIRVFTRQATDHLPALGVALVGDGTGVDHAEFCRVPVSGLLVTELHQSLAHELGLVLVDLATQGDGFEQCGHTTGLRFRFDRGRHRPLALSDHDVLAKRMNLVSLQFCVFHRGRQADDLAVTVHLGCQFVPLLHGVAEKGLQHPDHVLVGVMFIIPENNVVSRLLLNLPVLFYNRLRLLENNTFFLLGDHFHTRGGKTCGTSR